MKKFVAFLLVLVAMTGATMAQTAHPPHHKKAHHKKHHHKKHHPMHKPA